MRSRFLDTYNLVNMLRNGGLDFDLASDGSLPFWEIVNASPGAQPPENAYTIVKGEVPDSELGAPNYLRFALVSDRVVEIKYDMRLRYQERVYGKTTPPWIQQIDVHDSTIPEQYLSLESQLIRGSNVTLSFSAKVPQGGARVSLLFDFEPNAPVQDEIDIYDSLESKEWVRPASIAELGGRRLNYFSIRIERTSAGAAEVHLGSISMARGSVSSLPYTGDPGAEGIPKGAIIFAFGGFCPPGYEKMSFTAPKRSGRIFPMSSDETALDTQGEETHNHSDAEMTMNPEIDWPKKKLLPRSETGHDTPADSSEESHKHAIEKAVHVPPSKDVILCKRL
jgi:hypothetical protein